jgi:RNA polymerase sigma-70 factor (ECF subfamily)
VTDDASSRFEALYRQHFRAVLRYALARLEPESARDVAAETFLIAWRRLPDVPDNAAPWLFGVARKVISGQLRSDTRREALRLRLTGTGATEPGLDEEVAQRAVVLAALARLGEGDREVLRLIAWDGLTSTAAAEVLGVSRLAFGVRLHRARRRFTAALEAAETISPYGHADSPAHYQPGASGAYPARPITNAKEAH